MASRLQDVILRGVSGARPLATLVAPGTLYYSTDTATTDRSDGTVWETYADSGGSSSVVNSILPVPFFLEPVEEYPYEPPIVIGSLSDNGGGTGSGFTPGSIPFANSVGVLTQDNSNLFWDDTNNRLGIGTNAPIRTVDIFGAVNARIIFHTTASGPAINNGLDILLNNLDAYLINYGGPLFFWTNNNHRWSISSAGDFLAFIDNTFDIGALGATRPRTGYFGTSIVSPRAHFPIAPDVDITGAFGTSVPLFVAAEQNSNTGIVNTSFGAAHAIGGWFAGAKTRSAGIDANTIVQNDDELSRWIGYGADGVLYRPAAYIQFSVDGVPGVNDMPGRIVFATSPDGTITPFERMRINNAGLVSIGHTAPTARLHLPAGTAASSSAPLKINTGTLLTAPELGAVEYLDDATTGHFYGTVSVAGVPTRVQLDASSAVLSTPQKTRQIGIVVDGAGSVLTTGLKGYKTFPVAGTITGVRLLADQVGSIVIDIWKDSYANYPPTVADTITAGAKPTISAANKSEDTTLTGWTTSVSAGDIFGFNIDSVTTITEVILELTVVVA